MKLVKSLLLGSAAGLVAVAGAQAADLPVRKAAPVDYVRVCSTYGAGYFFIPGSDTCLRISGFVDGEALYQTRERSREDFDTFGMRARFRINLDARQPTEYACCAPSSAWTSVARAACISPAARVAARSRPTSRGCPTRLTCSSAA